VGFVTPAWVFNLNPGPFDAAPKTSTFIAGWGREDVKGLPWGWANSQSPPILTPASANGGLLPVSWSTGPLNLPSINNFSTPELYFDGKDKSVWVFFRVCCFPKDDE
jgi:hypothetical protein